MGHVHGLGVDPEDGTLYAATHFGVFRVGDGGDLTRIADRWQDTMAFTVVGPEHFLGSGHPDLREDLPSHLGLIESLDAAESWSVLSLGGRGGLPRPRHLRRSHLWVRRHVRPDHDHHRPNELDHGCEWSPSSTWPPTPPTPTGSSLRHRTARCASMRCGSSRTTLLDDAPRVVLVEWPTGELLVGVTASGQRVPEHERRRELDPRRRCPWIPEAFDVTDRAWHVATDRGIYRSEDGGSTWTLVAESTH